MNFPFYLIIHYFKNTSISPFSTFPDITAPNTPLERTLQQFLDRKYFHDYVYINANDQISDESFAHSKFFLHFEGDQGYVILHSLPKFFIDKVYSFFGNVEAKGQHIVCLTMDKNGLNLFAELIYTIAPRMQLTEISNGFLNSNKAIWNINQKIFETRPDINFVKLLKTADGTEFYAFAKNKKSDLQLWTKVPERYFNTVTHRSGIIICKKDQNLHAAIDKIFDFEFEFQGDNSLHDICILVVLGLTHIILPILIV